MTVQQCQGCHKKHRSGVRYSEVSSSDWIHKISEAELTRLMYSASMLDLATRVCFLDNQDTRLGPRKMQESEVDLLSSGLDP